MRWELQLICAKNAHFPVEAWILGSLVMTQPVFINVEHFLCYQALLFNSRNNLTHLINIMLLHKKFALVWEGSAYPRNVSMLLLVHLFMKCMIWLIARLNLLLKWLNDRCVVGFVHWFRQPYEPQLNPSWTPTDSDNRVQTTVRILLLQKELAISWRSGSKLDMHVCVLSWVCLYK